MLEMKSCPSCSRTYSDASLSYCLNDGSLLSAPYNTKGLQRNPFADEPETAISKSNTKLKANIETTLKNDRIYFGDNFSIGFQRTLRIPDDGKNIRCRPD